MNILRNSFIYFHQQSYPLFSPLFLKEYQFMERDMFTDFQFLDIFRTLHMYFYRKLALDAITIKYLNYLAFLIPMVDLAACSKI